VQTVFRGVEGDLHVQNFSYSLAAGSREAVRKLGGNKRMDTLLRIVLVVFSLGLIAVVLLQKGKSAGLSGAISGGAEHLFGKQKARGLDLFLQRLTIGLAAGFFILALLVAYLK
jgi:preprotein translocase subunit SecG